MAKEKAVFVCQNCGYISPKWVGKCSNCNSWNSFIEEVQSVDPKGLKSKTQASAGNAIKISEIRKRDISRIKLPYDEFNRVLGGGLVPGSLVLLGGEPGIGKSTLVLQTVLNLKDQKVLYVSGEESENQIKLRAERIGIKTIIVTFIPKQISKKLLQRLKQLNHKL
jgi:DNA repair protein RadA/Sms